MALGIGWMTPVPRRIARALVRGLSHDSIVTHRNAHETYPEVNLMDFESATREALTRLHPLKIERVWEDGESHITLKHEGFFIDHRKIKVDAEPERVFNIIKKVADHLGLRRYVVDATEPNHLLLLRSQRKNAGDGWLEWRLSRDGDSTYLTQTVFFAPRGLAGFAYWYLLYPFHVLRFRDLLQKIKRKCDLPHRA
jgi:hypothetical protein